jgi:hypothetical protein
MWDKQKAIEYLDKHALGYSIGHCAQYTRLAIEAGGLTLIHHESAKDYGSSLLMVGFVAVAANGSASSLAGDVGIVQPIPDSPHGHMAMFDGTHWVSDFIQMHGLYPGPKYRELKPAYTIYRYTN